MSGAAFPKHLRLRKRPEFLRVQRGGRRVKGRLVIAIGRSNSLGHSRFGLVVSRKVGNSVVRNRVKRWFREIVRCADRSPPVDVVLIARAPASEAGFTALRADVMVALGRLTRETTP